MEFEEKTLASRLIYDGRIMKVYCDDVSLSDGSRSKREYIRHSGGAGILAIDDEGCTYLVSQFRYPYRDELLEIPAGKREEGEEPIETARRELEEEIGFVADDISLLAIVYPTPAYTDEKLYVYLATGLHRTHAHLDQGEFLRVKRMPLGDAIALADQGKITDSKTLVALYKTAYKANA